MASSKIHTSSFHEKTKGVTHRRLKIESLETREMLSVTLADLPTPDFDPVDSAYVSGDRSGVADMETAPVAPPTGSVVSTEATVNLAPPKSARPAYVATPTTLTVNWSSPVPSKTLNTDRITGFEVVLINAKTKQVVAKQTVGAGERSALFEGLDVKTRYQITVTSKGDEGTSSTKGTLKISATTAAFPAVTIKASSQTMTSVKLTITDKDKITAFQDGKTVKEYTIQYIEKGYTVDWSKAISLPPIQAGTGVADLKKGTIVTELDGLTPGTTYLFRVIATYADGVNPENEKTITAEGRQSSTKTLKLPATSISKTNFAVIDKTNYDFAVGLTGKVASYSKLGSNVEIGFSLLVSTSTKTNKSTGILEGAKSIAGTSYSGIDSKGVFTMNPVSLESIVEQLGRETVLGSKTLSFQLAVTFTFDDGMIATVYSKIGRATMPTWYHPA